MTSPAEEAPPAVAWKGPARLPPAVVEEFYPQDIHPAAVEAAPGRPATNLRGKLESQVARLASG